MPRKKTKKVTDGLFDIEEDTEDENLEIPNFDSIPEPPKPKEKLPNHIEEYFANKEGNKEYLISKELFNADKDVDIKTELENLEISYITTLLYNNQLLLSKGLKPVYKDFLNNLMRLKISLKRQSRKEFVEMNKTTGKTEDVLKGMSDLTNIQNAKK